MGSTGNYYTDGATVILTATPNTGSTFASWSPSPCAASFAMPANDLTCTATFTADLNTYLLSVGKAGTGSGTVSGGGNYAAGAIAALTATPDAGSVFAGWSPSPCAASFTMPASNLTCTATFNAVTVNPAAVSSLVFSGDYNGDTRADLIWHHETTGQVYGMLLDGYSITQQGMVYAEPNPAWRIVSNGDFDGNGNSDLLWWNSATGQVYQMPMNGLNIAGGAQIYQEPNTTWQIVAVGDLNGDRKADLVWWNSSSGHVYAMLIDIIRNLNQPVSLYHSYLKNQ